MPDGRPVARLADLWWGLGRKFQPVAMDTWRGRGTGVPAKRSDAGFAILILNMAGAVSELSVPKKPKPS